MQPNLLSQKRGLLSRVVEPALQLWLRSQAESVESLQLNIHSEDRQLLSGCIPQIQLVAQQAVYQGLHLSCIKLMGHNIRVNLGQLLQGKSLRLLESITVDFFVQLQIQDVQASSAAPLFQEALLNALGLIAGEPIAEVLGTSVPPKDWVLQNPTLKLGSDCLRLSTHLTVQSHPSAVPVVIQTGLALKPPHTLVLCNPEWLPTPHARRGLPLQDLHGYQLDLGPQIQLQHFAITAEGITGHGQMTILP